jgi:hypothetical protein
MRRFTQLVVLSACGAALVAGCNGGGGSGATRRDAPSKRPSVSSSTTTTTAPKVVRIDLSKPIPGGSLHGTPRPTLENTGTNYVAILKSLIATSRWQGENPDVGGVPAVDDLYLPGTTAHDGRVRDTQILIDAHHHWADDNYRLISVGVQQVVQQPRSVLLRVVDTQDDEKIVDAAGVQFGAIQPRGSSRAWTYIISPDAYGRWRIAGGAQTVDDPTVQL